MTEKIIGVMHIDRKCEFVTFSDDTVGAITTMFDEDGEDTRDPSECVAIMCEHNIRGPVYVDLMNDYSAGDGVQ